MGFKELLKESGCQLDSSHVTLEVEPVLFRRKLNNKLRSQSNGFEEFSQDMQQFTEDQTTFRLFLLPSILGNSVPKTSRTSNSDSLFKTLLAIDSLQPELITYLLERLPEFYDELETDNSSSCTARLILHQLRWLDYIAQPEILTGKLIEVIQITPPVIQHEIITSLPDIVNDSEHKPIVVYLKELMNENSELTVPILDALSNLTLHSESLEDVRETVLERLESAELDDLAVIIKFLLQTVTPLTIDSVVYGIRQKLNFRAFGKTQQQMSSSQRRSEKSAPEALILESIKLGLQFHKFIFDSWFKSIAALESQREHKIIDVLVLIILYSMTSMKKKVESLIRKKILQGTITSSLIQETIMNHSDGLVGYWSTVLSLSESLLRSCSLNSAISPCANILYTASFKSSDMYYRQEIIGALVTHIGSGVDAEMDVALNVILNLVTTNVSSVAVYSVFVKGILDYLDNLNDYQIRILFDIFSLLALTTGNSADGSANLWSEIRIVIRKQLSNPREKYKNIGIIASLSAVKVLGSRQLCNDQLGAGSSSTQVHPQRTSIARHPLLRQATELIETLLQFTKDYPNCITLLYDELAYMVSEEDLDQRMQSWIQDKMTSDFTEFYVLEISDANEFIQSSHQNQYLKLEPEKMMNLDGEDCLIAVKMYQLLYNPDVKAKKVAMVPFCSIFNLIQSCEKKLNAGDLSAIDALFGCCVILFNNENIDDITAEEVEYACDMLFYTINWFREVLNAFMFTTEENFRARIVTRIRNILELEILLLNLMKQVSEYAPLEFQSIAAHTTEGHAKNSTQMMINSAASTESQDSTNGDQNPKQKSTKKDMKSSLITFATVNELRPYMRAFNIHILQVFKYNQEITDEDQKMTYKEINYVLNDLNHKLNIKIVPPPPAIFGRKKVTTEDKFPSCNATFLARIDARNFMKKVVQYLPSLLQMLENAYVDIQSMDIMPGRVDEDTEEIASSISILFDVLFKLISWPDIQNSDNMDILRGIIQSIADRTSSIGSQKNAVSFEEELSQAFQYLCQYIDNIPQAKTALLFFKTLQRLMIISENPSSLKSTAMKVVDQIMTTEWFDWRDIKKDIPFLLEEWIALNDDPLEFIHDFIGRVLPQYEDQGKLEEFPLLNADTVVQHYQAILNCTVKSFDLLNTSDQETDAALVETARMVKIFERITTYVKNHEQKALLSVLLRSSRLFIEQFTKHSIPFFTSIFKSYSAYVIAIFKDFQSSTRMLQILCSHVKVLKEVQLAGYVPPLKKALEIVIYQVKMLLTENRMPSNAFFMGALKHRDIRGAEVSSQIPHEEYENSEEEVEKELSDKSEAEEEDEEMTESPPSSASGSKMRTMKKSPAKSSKKSTPTKRPVKPRKKSSLSYSVIERPRTTSVVPSSSDEGEEVEEEVEAVHVQRRKQKRRIDAVAEEADEEGDEIVQEKVIEMNLESSESEEDKEAYMSPNVVEHDEDDVMSAIAEESPPPMSRSPSPAPKKLIEKVVKRKRSLGIGKPRLSQKKVFSFTEDDE